MSEHIVRLSSNRDPRASLLGTVGPRKFDQLLDVNMIGVADKDLVGYDAASQTYVPLAAVAVPSILRDAIAKGDYGDFVTVWNTLKSIMPPSQQLITEITTLATALNLPQEFIDIFTN